MFKSSYNNPEQAQSKSELVKIYKNTPDINILTFLCL